MRSNNKMNLIIDQGNTNLKLYIFSSNKIKHFFIFPINKDDFSFLDEYKFEKTIYSSVSGFNNALLNALKSYEILYFSAKIKLPIINSYKSETIGIDRLAGAVGSTVLFPGEDILNIDIGSAITYDFIKKGKEFVGGNISPGLILRFKSLNDYTANLPLLEPKEVNFLLADNTNDAIIGGIMNGILFEINTYIEKISTENQKIKVVFTGGDSNLFVKKIKYSIFAELNLVAIGLNQILNFNSEL